MALLTCLVQVQVCNRQCCIVDEKRNIMALSVCRCRLQVCDKWGFNTTWITTVYFYQKEDCGVGAQEHTVRKMGLILRSIERMLKMQFSIARKFTLQLLRRYDVKPPEKTAQA
jgi:hypothetical protein